MPGQVPPRHGRQPRAPGAGASLETPGGTRVLTTLDDMAASRGAAHATIAHATIAPAWLAAQPTVAAPIASALDQLPALLAVADLTLTPEELNRLTEASA